MSIEQFVASGEPLVAAALDWAAPLPGHARALEIGCGVGRFTTALAQRFERVDAVDVSPTMLALAAQLGLPANAHLHLGSGRDLSGLPDGAFDLAFSHLVFQHIADRSAIASYLRRAGAHAAARRGRGAAVRHAPAVGRGDRAARAARSAAAAPAPARRAPAPDPARAAARLGRGRRARRSPPSAVPAPPSTGCDWSDQVLELAQQHRQRRRVIALGRAHVGQHLLARAAPEPRCAPATPRSRRRRRRAPAASLSDSTSRVRPRCSS